MTAIAGHVLCMKYDAQPSKIKEPFGGFHLENDVELWNLEKISGFCWSGAGFHQWTNRKFFVWEVLGVNPFCEPGCYREGHPS